MVMIDRKTSFMVGLLATGFVAALAIADDGPPSLGEMCRPGYAIERRMSYAEAREIKRAMLPPGSGMADWRLDHIRPLCLGGSNSRANLQLQRPEEAARKDELEVYACREVCRGTLDHATAWAWFDDWETAYRTALRR